MNFEALPPIYIFSNNLPSDELHEAEDHVYESGGHLTYQPNEARIFLGRLTQKKRVAFELRSHGLWTEEAQIEPQSPPAKRRKLDQKSRAHSGDLDNETLSEDESQKLARNEASELPDPMPDLSGRLIVLRLDWLLDCIKANAPIDYEPYMIYYARIVDKPSQAAESKPTSTKTVTFIKATAEAPSSSQAATASNGTSGQSIDSILDRTKAAPSAAPFRPRRFKDQSSRSNNSGIDAIIKSSIASHPRLHRATTSEHDHIPSRTLPPPPKWLQETNGRNYACMRSTFANTPNYAFIQNLHKIKEARLLTLDEIGVRAYSTAIASLSAYPYPITEPEEVTRLPGCSDKIALLWLEWHDSYPPPHSSQSQSPSPNPSQSTLENEPHTQESKEEIDAKRTIRVVTDLANNTDLKHLKLFHDIWGVGPETARKFYFEKGWKDLDDVVEFGWHTGALNRVQQIGVKFYDEFLVKIPRSEVEDIADVILRHARTCRGIPRSWWSKTGRGFEGNKYGGNWNKLDDGRGDQGWDERDMVCVIVGGYRRGKTESGDVDVILSHKDEEVTKDLVVDVVRSLEEEGWITHTLTLHTTGSERDQATLPYRVSRAGGGFDTLDKALCVWQNPRFDKDAHEKNPNIHRRVDIIISPWRTVGSAVLGWSGATTFERDIRRWVRKEKNWKFDSSGIRDRGDATVFDFERPVDGDKSDCWQDRERRLMEGIGIGWRPGIERCTG